MAIDFVVRASDSPFVDCVWRSVSDNLDEFVSVASSHWHLVVSQHRGRSTVTVLGPASRAVTAAVPPDTTWFGIRFRLGTLLSGLPLQQFVDGHLDLPTASAGSFRWRDAAVPLAAFASAEDLVDRLLREDLIARDPLIEDVLRSGRTDLSVRTVRRRYLASTGLPAVTVRQIERARLAAIRLREGVAPVDAAYELGYVDQSHLTHSVRRFIGATPANLRSPGLVPLSLLYKTGVNGSPTVVFDGIPTLERRHDAQDRPRDDDDAQRTAR